jgi:hypothetical protein
MKRIFIVSLALCVMGLWVAQAAWSAEAAKNKDVTIKGKVTVQKGTDGKITSIKLMHKDKVACHIVLDAKGMELGNTLADKHVEVTGAEETKNSEKWITVKSFKELTRPEKKENKK